MQKESNQKSKYERYRTRETAKYYKDPERWRESRDKKSQAGWDESMYVWVKVGRLALTSRVHPAFIGVNIFSCSSQVGGIAFHLIIVFTLT